MKLTPVQVLALACVGVLLGQWLRRRISLLDRLDIPGPIAGGMVYALAVLALRWRGVFIEADASLRDLLMIAFMTTIGLSASFDLIRKSGRAVGIMLALASGGAIVQNIVGMGIARAMGQDMRLGIMAGSAALTGGPATAVAFGTTFERMGMAGATAIGMASATFGIAVAGLIGGYVGGVLIKSRGRGSAALRDAVIGPSVNIVRMVLLVGIAMGAGSLLSGEMERRGLILPSYIGAMIVAAVIRNLDDRFHFAHISQPDVDAIGRIALPLFIVMALITLRLWELAHLALPALVILLVEVALCWIACVTIVHRAMGRDYEAAVMSAGFCGFMLGITANAIACMEELVEKYGPAPQAFLVVPVVGAFLVDLTNSLIITAMANFIR